MLATMLKQGVAAVVGLTIAAPASGAPVQVAPTFAAGDGAATPAACAPMGFDLTRAQDRETAGTGPRGRAMAMTVAPPPPPPPPRRRPTPR